MPTTIADVLDRNKLDRPPILNQVLVLLADRKRETSASHTPIMTLDEIKAVGAPLPKVLVGAYITFKTVAVNPLRRHQLTAPSNVPGSTLHPREVP